MDKRIVKTIIFSGLVLIGTSFLLLRYDGFIELIDFIAKIFRPVIFGLVLAFVLNKPLGILHTLYLKPLDRRLARPQKKKKLSEKSINRHRTVAYALALLTVYLIFAGFLTGVILVIVPQFADSVKLFYDNSEMYYNNFISFAEKNLALVDIEKLREYGVLDKSKEMLTSIMDNAPDFILKALDVTKNAIETIIDLLIGLVVSIYILADKPHLKRQAYAVSRYFIPKKYTPKVNHYTRLTLDSFTNFIAGQVTEAIIIGVLCFIGMSIARFDYAVMISVIVGVTNVIPIVGPIIGAIPSALVLLLVEPSQAFYFIIFIIFLQQLESNLIYPRVVGNSVGLPPLWTLLAVIIGGGLFGILGMILGIPVLSVIYMIMRDETEKRKIEEEAEYSPPVS